MSIEKKKKKNNVHSATRILSIIALYITLFPQISYALFNFRSKSSTLKIDYGCGLVLEHPLNYCSGQIIKEKGATISGHNISFEQGIFEDDGNRVKLHGDLRSDEHKEIRLTGNQLFKGKGALVNQKIVIIGQNNRIEGDLLLSDDIQLFDSNAGLTCALLRSLNKNIQLNSGTLRLDEDLYFLGDTKILGNGKILCSKRSIVLGAVPSSWNNMLFFRNINSLQLGSQLTLSQAWTFSGESCSIQGNGYPLFFENQGAFIIKRGTTLSLKNITLRNIKNDRIIIEDNSSTLICEDVTLVQSDNYSLTSGSLKIIGSLSLVGTATFLFSPQVTCTIEKNSELHIAPGMTFYYNALNGNKKLLYFTNNQSHLVLENSSLVVSSTGMQLEQGALFVQGAPRILIEQEARDMITLSEIPGLSLGNGNDENNDFSLYITPGSSLHITKGLLRYQNINPLSLGLDNPLSSIVVHTPSTLALFQPLYLAGGRLQLSEGASLLNYSGQSIIGSVEIYKE